MASEHERIAKAFHDEYEARAPQHGYETREASAVPWEQVPEANRNLMVGTVDALLRQGVIYPASVLEERDRELAEMTEWASSAENPLFDEGWEAGTARGRKQREELRSQLTEARARNLELLKSECPNCDERLRVNVGLVIENKELRKRVDELEHGVPAPQDREPTRPRSKLRWD